MQTLSAADAPSSLRTRSARRVEAGVGALQPQAALRDDADAAPAVVDDLEDAVHYRQRLRIALALHGAAVLVLDLVPSRLELLDEHVRRLEEVERLEAADDDRHAVLLRQPLVVDVAGDGADVSRRQEALHPVVRRRCDRFQGGRHQDVRS